MAWGGQSGPSFLGISQIKNWFSNPDKNNQLQQAYLLAGSDSGTIEEVVGRLAAHHYPEKNEGHDKYTLDAAKVSPAEIVDAWKEISMFQTTRLFVITSAEKMFDEKKYPDIGERIQELDSETLVILIMSDTARKLSAKPLVKLFLQNKRAAYLYAPRDEQEATRWLQGYCHRHSIQITPGAAALTATMVGFETSELVQEIRKMAYALEISKGETIDEKVVEEHIIPHRESPPFEWADAIIDGNPRAIAFSSSATGFGQRGMMAIGALNSRFTEIERLRQNEPIAPFRKSDVERAARKWNPQRISRAQTLLFHLDLDLKSKSTDTRLARIETATAKLLNC